MFSNECIGKIGEPLILVDARFGKGRSIPKVGLNMCNLYTVYADIFVGA